MNGDREALQESPPWSRTTKTIVVIIGLILVVAIGQRFSLLIGQIVTAAVLAYVLNPLIKFVNENTPLQRGTLVVLTYFSFILLVIGAMTGLGVAVYAQVQNLTRELPRLIDNAVDLFQNWLPGPDSVFLIGPFEFDPAALNWEAIQQQVLGAVEPVISRTGTYATQLAGATLRIIGNFLFIWVISIYIALELPRLRDYIGAAAQQPGYRRDAERLMAEFARIWSAYLRGQIILGLTIGIIVGVSLGLMGVQNALALGLLSGLLEFVPVVGPLIGTAAAVIVAFFQPSNYLGLSSLQFALSVLGVMFVIQQLENNILVPRIVGEALDLHPLLVIVGVFMGASIAGILGAILAAPVLATFKLLALYAWRKLFDLPPFADERVEVETPSPGLPARVGGLWVRLRERVQKWSEATDATTEGRGE